MQHFGNLDAATRQRLFDQDPVTFDRSSPAEDLAAGLGGTLYTPATRPDLATALVRQHDAGTTSMVLCLEDAIPDDQVAAGEANLVDALVRAHAVGHATPLLFVRVREYTQIRDLVRRLGSAALLLTGFVLPKFTPAAGPQFLDAVAEARDALGHPIYAMPVMESPAVIHQESRHRELDEIAALLQRRRDLVLALRIGATDLSATYGLRRSREHTVYDVRVVADVIGDVVNRLGRTDGSGFPVSGPVWEYFSNGDRIFRPGLRQTLFEEHRARALRAELLAKDLDGLIREVVLDRANGLTGKSVIHPTHVPLINALQVVSHEEYVDAEAVLASAQHGGVAASRYRNKMNESKPHTSWAVRTSRRARMFGVARPEIAFVDVLTEMLP